MPSGSRPVNNAANQPKKTTTKAARPTRPNTMK